MPNISTIEYDTTFQDLTLEADGVTARLTHAVRGEEEELVRCRYLIAADGITMGDVVWHSRWETWVRLAVTTSS